MKGLSCQVRSAWRGGQAQLRAQLPRDLLSIVSAIGFSVNPIDAAPRCATFTCNLGNR
ncbi:hypothetical protein HYPGJ_10387 [Hyphomicrobium sp. GJ21]|nr:hypothetical protein HYPGJ_10387 [Hyphomicrobium sp. GJ21]